MALALMPYSSRFNPAGAVSKYYAGQWMEPGITGRVTPVFPVTVSWMDANADAFWGPAMHYNTFLDSYVMLLNRSCCSPGFPQDGIHVSFSADLSDPASWTEPKAILRNVGWYPQVLGLGPQGTDRVAGRVARLYVDGHSQWDIVFERPAVVRPISPAPPE